MRQPSTKRNRRPPALRSFQPQLLVIGLGGAVDPDTLTVEFQFAGTGQLFTGPLVISKLPNWNFAGPGNPLTGFVKDETGPNRYLATFAGQDVTEGGTVSIPAWDSAIRTNQGGWVAPQNVTYTP